MERVRKAPLALVAVFLPLFAFAGESERFRVPAEGFGWSVNDALISFKAKDAFAGLANCTILDAQVFIPYSLPEAIKVIKPCLESLSDRYNITLEARPGDIGPITTQRLNNGILIDIKSPVPSESSFYRDFQHSLLSRNNSILGFPARLSREGTFRTQNEPEQAGRSMVQDTLDRCILPTVIRPIRSGSDFVKHYGGCITKDKVLNVREIRPSSGHKLAVTLQCEAGKPSIDTLNGYVTVYGEDGPVEVLIIAYPLTIELP